MLAEWSFTRIYFSKASVAGTRLRVVWYMVLERAAMMLLDDQKSNVMSWRF
jgi:hypothetical protein